MTATLQRGAALALALGVAASAVAGLGPQNVVVIVNDENWVSIAVANEFVRLRGIPPARVIALPAADLGTGSVDADVFRARLLEPVLSEIERRGLATDTDGIAWSAGFPYAVTIGGDLKAGGGAKPPRHATPVASLNGMTYLFRWVRARDPGYVGMTANGYAGRPYRAVRAGVDGDGDAGTMSEEEVKSVEAAVAQIDRFEARAALPVIESLAAKYPAEALLHFQLARGLSMLREWDGALKSLRRAADAGWMVSLAAEREEAFQPLRKRPEYREAIRAMAFSMTPARPFRASEAWNENGRPAAPDEGGQFYVLSTMLACTSGRGTSVRQSLDGLARSAAADGTRPKGTVHFMVNNDIRSRTRWWGFPAAARWLEALGVRAELTEGVLPKGRDDVAGLMAGSAQFDWPASKNAIRPGAICENLTSAGGVMTADAGQTSCSEFLKAGAAGTCGPVTEPYSIQNKFPSPFLQCYYASGLSLAESFYLSIRAPYQMLILGDPLCRPWARMPVVSVAGVEAGARVGGPLDLRPAVDETAGPRARMFKLYADGARRDFCLAGGRLTWWPPAADEGWHELDVVGLGADAAETPGWVRVPVLSGSRSCELTIEAPSSGGLAWETRGRARVACEGAKEIALLAGGREIGRVEGPAGEVELRPWRIGIGRVRLQARAVCAGPEGDVRVWSAPAELDVAAPRARRALPSGPSDPVPGLSLETGGATWRFAGLSAPAKEGAKALWAAMGVRKGQALSVEGFCEMASDALAQLEVRSGGGVAVEIDGDALELPPGKVWRYAPVALAAGWHRVRVTVPDGDLAGLDVRFGVEGTRPLDGRLFRVGAALPEPPKDEPAGR